MSKDRLPPKWSKADRALFKRIKANILELGPELFLHPKTIERKMSADEFHTIAWNAAWLAVDLYRKPSAVVKIAA